MYKQVSSWNSRTFVILLSLVKEYDVGVRDVCKHKLNGDYSCPRQLQPLAEDLSIAGWS